MATLSAKLRFRDGQSQNIYVTVESNLNSLNNGINNLNANVSKLLSELVEREKARGACAVGEEEDGDDDEEEEEEEFLQTPENVPPAKKPRT